VSEQPTSSEVPSNESVTALEDRRTSAEFSAPIQRLGSGALVLDSSLFVEHKSALDSCRAAFQRRLERKLLRSTPKSPGARRPISPN
jgi:hypothetical protein